MHDASDNRYQRRTASGPEPYTLPREKPPRVPMAPRIPYQAHRGGAALALALLGFLICPIFAFPALLIASHDRKQIHAGVTDPSGEGLVLAAYWLALIQVVFTLLGLFFIVLLAAAN